MALTRKYLKSLGLTDDQIEGIIEEYISTVDGLKETANKYKADAEKLPAVQKELDDLKAAGDGGYKEKYEAEVKAHKEYKQQVEAEKEAARTDADVLDLCKAAGIARESSLRLVSKDFDRSKIKRGEDGKITNRDELLTAIKADYADFVATPGEKGTPTITPPGSGKNYGGLSREDIMKISDRTERRAAIAQNLELFGGSAK